MEVYVVLAYFDYHDGTKIEVLKVFKEYDKALTFIKPYIRDEDMDIEGSRDVTIIAETDHGIIYDLESELEMKLDSEDITIDEYNLLNNEENRQKRKETLKELDKCFKGGKCWADRIAIAKTSYE